MSETLYEIFQRSPQEALDKLFAISKADTPWNSKKTIFMYQSALGVCGKVRYGGFRYVSREEVDTRSYELEFWDGTVTIFWTDVLFDPHRAWPNKFIKKEAHGK
jgi:hypothetical protein